MHSKLALTELTLGCRTVQPRSVLRSAGELLLHKIVKWQEPAGELPVWHVVLHRSEGSGHPQPMAGRSGH